MAFKPDQVLSIIHIYSIYLIMKLGDVNALFACPENKRGLDEVPLLDFRICGLAALCDQHLHMIFHGENEGLQGFG